MVPLVSPCHCSFDERGGSKRFSTWRFNLYQLFGVGALAHRGLPPDRGFVREVPLAFPAPHLSAREGCPCHCGTLTGLGGNSGVQDSLCHKIDWHEGFRHSETVAAGRLSRCITIKTTPTPWVITLLTISSKYFVCEVSTRQKFVDM